MQSEERPQGPLHLAQRLADGSVELLRAGARAQRTRTRGAGLHDTTLVGRSRLAAVHVAQVHLDARDLRGGSGKNALDLTLDESGEAGVEGTGLVVVGSNLLASSFSLG